MQAGQLDQKVSIQEASESTTETGGVSRVWAERVATWAGIAPQGWTRRNQERRLRNDVTHSVTLRRISWLDYDSHRIVWNGKTMAIRAIFDPGPRSSTMVVDCVEITA